MKYMIMLYASQREYDQMSGKPDSGSDQPAWDAEDVKAMYEFMYRWNQELVDSGEFVEARGLTAPVHTRRIHDRAVGGLTTAEVARAFLVPEPTMSRRISRAKQRIQDSGIRFGLPPAAERADRLGVVLHVLYLIFNEPGAYEVGDAVGC